MSDNSLSLRLLRRLLTTLLRLVEDALKIPTEYRKLQLSDLFQIPPKKTKPDAAFESYIPYAVPANDFLFNTKKPPEVVATITLPEECFQRAYTKVEAGFVFREKYGLVAHFRDNDKINFVIKNNEEARIIMSTSFMIGMMGDWIEKFYSVKGPIPYITVNGQPQALGLMDANTRAMSREANAHILVNLSRKKLRGEPLE